MPAIDEIQVYDADINSPGQFSVQLHNNYTPAGRKLPDFERRIVPNHTLNGVPEWAYGVLEWLELGAYVPVYSWTGDGRFLIDGAKLRAEFVVPHAQDRSFFFGVNFELSSMNGRRSRPGSSPMTIALGFWHPYSRPGASNRSFDSLHILIAGDQGVKWPPQSLRGFCPRPPQLLME